MNGGRRRFEVAGEDGNSREFKRVHESGADMTAQPQHKRSLWLGALIAPLVVPLVIWAHEIIRYFLFGPFGTPSLKVTAELFIVIAKQLLPVTYIIVFGLVMPFALWLRAYNALSSIRLCAWCSFLGPVISITYIWLSERATDSWPQILQGVLGFAFTGLVVGVAFGAISRIRLFVRKQDNLSKVF